MSQLAPSTSETPSAIDGCDEDEETARRLDEEAIAEMEAQGSISWEAVKRWMRSWGLPDELPPPRVGD